MPRNTGSALVATTANGHLEHPISDLSDVLRVWNWLRNELPAETVWQVATGEA